MRKLLLLLLLLTAGAGRAAAQRFDYARDFKVIARATTEPTNRLFYDSLKSRFARDSRLLSTEEVVALQIGHTQRPEYDPYGRIKLERTFIQAADWSKTDTTVLYGTAYLKVNPVSLGATYALWHAYLTRHQDALAAKYQAAFQALIAAMLSTGDGTTERPYLAVGPIDGQILIRQYWKADIGLMGSGRDKNRNFLDMLTMISPDGKSTTQYFVIEHATGRM